ncbi:MAG: Asp-tRNA(Asn)/Glu-tRNA(Gln) amidotransferase subunit GatB [Myxococcales bacterium]|nr:Asp-tRNA(Asn)/Glu-tRNA(Gln) amidotransferase subunit GatB [Myxococcales bacterium]
MAISDYEVVIGLEVHCQLDTASKMFSACGYAIGAEANTRTDPYTWGLPGTLPVPNRRAVDHALRLALAMGCEVQAVSRWARKHYFYPDLPKGYQITQADQPYARGGSLEIPGKRIHLQRIHMEEDAGKNTHDASPEHSLVDYNRAGAPLVEIVSEPELRSAAEAADYMRELRTLVRYLGISEANMEEGTLRCDANVSLRRRDGDPDVLGVRCEIKNLNSFKFLEAAINAEIRRQTDLLDRGEAVVQSTLSYDPSRDRTKVMRSKEEAADYRYFPEPDMPPLRVDVDTLDRLRAELPELPGARRRRLVGLGLSDYDAGVLCAERELADYFDGTLAALGQEHAKEVSNWISGEILRLLNSHRDEIARCPIDPAALAALIALVQSGAISRRTGKEVLDKAYDEGLSPAQIVERDGLRQVSDSGAIEAMVREVMDQNPAQVQQLRDGKDKVRGFFVGQVMRKSRGQANPQLVQEALDKLLAELQKPD